MQNGRARITDRSALRLASRTVKPRRRHVYASVKVAPMFLALSRTDPMGRRKMMTVTANAGMAWIM